MLYVDTSALLKRYITEADSSRAQSLLAGYDTWATARHTLVEVRRNLARLLEGPALAEAQGQFRADWNFMAVVELDKGTLAMAADIAEITGARSLDAMHLAAARRLGLTTTTFMTFDLRQGQAARQVGLTVVGG